MHAINGNEQIFYIFVGLLHFTYCISAFQVTTQTPKPGFISVTMVLSGWLKIHAGAVKYFYKTAVQFFYFFNFFNKVYKTIWFQLLK